MGADLIGAGIAAGADLVQSGIGLAQYLSGKKNLKDLEANRPQRTTDKNLLYNQRLTGAWAGVGMSDGAKNAYASNVNRNLASSLYAAISSGQSGGQLNSLLDDANKGFMNVAVMDDQFRASNRKDYLGANSVVADENQKNWEWNEAKPWLNKYQRAVQQTNAGMQNFMGGFRQLAETGTAMAAGGHSEQTASLGQANGFDWTSGATGSEAAGAAGVDGSLAGAASMAAFV